MITVPIPAWNAQGAIPPINAANPTAVDRSPYIVSLTDIVLRFGITPERRLVMDGLLRYRAALHAVGLTQGFQWLDGSFLEHIEMLESRAPNDIDIVTFYRLAPGQSQRDLQMRNSLLFPTSRAAQQQLKTAYHADAYFVNLAMAPERLVERSAYWYSLWSHRRNQLWKGYVQVDLAPTEDVAAGIALADLGQPGAQS